ncbi:MAG: universal stress protein [Flavobacteriales bacterium]|nr:universal stress protein [Flavobacteriales bacterium]
MPSIFHPTDLTGDREQAFLIALRLAVSAHAVLTVMHVADNEEDADMGELPGVRSTLARWGLIAHAEDMEGFGALRMGVRKVVREGRRPVQACLDHLDRHPADLIVLSTNQGQGLLKRKVAEPLSRSAGAPTLFVPKDASGLVDPRTGEVRMRKLLVPVDRKPDPRRAVEAAMRLAEVLGLSGAHFTLLHVGSASDAPRIDVNMRDGWTFDRMEREGDVVGTIVRTAREIDADAVVMTTDGRDGFLDALRGSTTERVLREVHCPVLAVPAEG